MKTIKILIIIGLSICVFNSIVIAEKSITISVSDYPSSYYKDKSENWAGVEIDVIKAVLNQAQLNFKFSKRPWAGAIMWIESGRIDILLYL